MVSLSSLFLQETMCSFFLPEAIIRRPVNCTTESHRPQMKCTLIDDEDGIEQADEFAQRLAQIEREWPESDMVRYKALLSTVDHPSLLDATQMMGEIDQYELRPEVAQTWGYAEMVFREKYPDLPEELFQTPQAAQIGQKMLDERLGAITEYGLIRRKDGQLSRHFSRNRK